VLTVELTTSTGITYREGPGDGRATPDVDAGTSDTDRGSRCARAGSGGRDKCPHRPRAAQVRPRRRTLDPPARVRSVRPASDGPGAPRRVEHGRGGLGCDDRERHPPRVHAVGRVRLGAARRRHGQVRSQPAAGRLARCRRRGPAGARATASPARPGRTGDARDHLRRVDLPLPAGLRADLLAPPGRLRELGRARDARLPGRPLLQRQHGHGARVRRHHAAGTRPQDAGLRRVGTRLRAPHGHRHVRPQHRGGRSRRRCTRPPVGSATA
jgi:hypothetical protein